MDENNLIMNNNISYKIISTNQKIENDKERIKSKFNFNISRTSTNSSAIKQSSVPTQQNSFVAGNKHFQIRDKLIQTNEKNKIKFISSQILSKKNSKKYINENDKVKNLSHANLKKNQNIYIKTKENLTNKKKKNNIPFQTNNTIFNKKLYYEFK